MGRRGVGRALRPYLVAASTLFLAGPIGITIAYHVPRNDVLAAAAPQSSPAADLWARYQREWTPWNHVRATAALAATTLLSVALYVS
jgi:uncharacterized membrane protein